MIRNLKTLGLTLVAVFALSAVSASSASAWFDWEGEKHPTATGSNLGVLIFATATEELSCEGLTFENGEVDGAEIKATPTFSKCTFTSGESSLPADFEPDGCKFVFHTDQKMELDCPAGKEIHVSLTLGKTKFNCLTIPEQTPKTPTAFFTNEGTGASRDIRVKAAVEGIKYTKKGFCGSGAFENGGFHGEMTIKGDNAEGKQVGIWWTEH
jgi:hypothetical protein